MNKINGEYPTNTYTRNDGTNYNQCWSFVLGLKYSF